MNPEQQKFVLENRGKLTAKQIARQLGLKEKNVIVFMKEARGRMPEAPAPAPVRSPLHPLVVLVLLTAVGFAAYSNSFHASFQFDDRKHIQESSSIKNISNLEFLWRTTKNRFLTVLSFALNYRFGGTEVFGYHVVNFAIHLLAGLTVFWLTLLIFNTPRMRDHALRPRAGLIALFAALIFIAHPLQTQAVTYIVQRGASMATLFYLLAVTLYMAARLGSWPLYLPAFIFTVASMFTKEISFTLPLAMLLAEFVFFGNPFKDPKARLVLLPFLATLSILPVFRAMSVAAEGGVLDALTRENVIISRGDYLLTQFNVICTYIRMLFFPLGQNLDHDYPISRHLLEPGSSLLSLIILLSIAGFGLWLLKRHRMISFGIFWFFLALSIESSIIPIKDVIVEHRVYLPMFGFVLAFTCGVFLLVKNPKACVILLSVVVVTLAGLTFARNRVWKDGISLWSDVIKKSPYKARPYMALGVSYADRKNYDKAIEYYKKALELQPHNAQIHYNLSNAYDRKDKRKEQIDHLEIAIQLSPDYASPYAALGLAYGKEGQYDKAIEYSKKALKLNPNHTQAHHNLGVAYAMSGKKEQALEQLAILKRMNRDDFASMLEQDIAEMGQPVQAGKDGVVTLPWRPGEGAAG